MNETFASRAETPQNVVADAGAIRRALVWDAPVRVFHWLMVACFAGAWLTAESERWRQVHATLGYTMAGLVAFRILWGLIGTRHARFASFVRGPAAVLRYVHSLLRGQPERHAGHNPAGALAIIALLGLTLAVGASGWAALNGIGGESFEELHEVIANLMLALVVLHVAGAVLGSWLHRENLIGAMIGGRKRVRPEERIRSVRRPVAGLVLAAVLGFWWLQWDASPSGASPADRSSTTATATTATKHDRDHDAD